MIYHITTVSAWCDAFQQGEYIAPSLAVEGFIHLSTAAQVMRVANAFYRTVPDLVILCVDETRLTSRLVWEAPVHPTPEFADKSINKELFPHSYGAINLAAIVNTVPFAMNEDGFVLPYGVV